MFERPLRILIAHNRYRSEQPSGEDRVVDLEVDLLRAAGHEVATFQRCSDEIAMMSATDRALTVMRVPWSRPSRLEFGSRLRAVRPDIVHLHNTVPLISPSVLAAAADAGIPVVATLHQYRQICPTGEMFRDGSACDECVGRLPWPSIRHGCYRGSRVATVPLSIAMMTGRRHWWTQVTKFFCVSAALRDRLIAAGMPADRMTVKHNFVPDIGVRSGPSEHVLYLGRLSKEKGLPLLMAAWERLTAARTVGLPLVIAGAGPLAATVEKWAAARSDVRYLGLLDREQCARVLRASAAVVVPSVLPETFGLVAVEAMSAGVPVVAAAHGGPPELVAHGVTGLLHIPGDADSLAAQLVTALDPANGERMGLAGRKRYEARFSSEVGLSRLIGEYESTIDQWRSRSPAK